MVNIRQRALSLGGAIVLAAAGLVAVTGVTSLPASAAPTSPTTTTLSAHATATFGSSLALKAHVSPSSGPTGTVSFSDVTDGQTYDLGSEPVSAGAATYRGPLPAVGMNAITATFSGDDTYESSTSGSSTDVEVKARKRMLVVTQLRFSGPGGPTDAYVDLENTSPTRSVPLAGWTWSTNLGTQALPNVTLAPGEAFLIAGSGFTLGGIAVPDQVSDDVSGADGFAVSPPSGGGANTDQVGYPVQAGYYGGSGLPYLSGSPTDQYAFVRRGSQVKPTDSGSNAQDFQLVSADAASLALQGGGAIQAVLGSPSPLSMTSAQQMDADLPSTLPVPSVSKNACPNRVVDTSGQRSVTLYRTITNTTGKYVTGLSLRITKLTEENAPGATSRSWLTAVPSATQTFSCAGGTTSYPAQGLSLDAPSTASGGLGTTLSPNLTAPLAPGASLTVALELDITKKGGGYSVDYDVDATTASSLPPYLPSGSAIQLTKTIVSTGTSTTTNVAPNESINLNSQTASFTLNASAFVDPASGTNGTLSFSWTIQYAGTPTFYTDAGITGTETPVLHIAQYALAQTPNATFTLTVTSDVNTDPDTNVTTESFVASITNGLLSLDEYNVCQETGVAGPDDPCTVPEALPAA